MGLSIVLKIMLAFKLALDKETPCGERFPLLFCLSLELKILSDLSEKYFEAKLEV